MRNKKAFSMIELIIVIVLISILATLSIPRLNRDNRAEAINHILTMIRYTHSLALHDDKQLADNPKWQKAFWRFEIKNCSNSSGIYYIIGSDSNLNGSISKTETAIDPSNGKYMFWVGSIECPQNSTNALNEDVSPNIFLTQKYGINQVTFKSCTVMNSSANKVYSSSKYIGFDSFGRYYKGFGSNNVPDYKGIGVGDCKIEFKFADGKKPFTIVVKKETGSVFLLNDDGTINENL